MILSNIPVAWVLDGSYLWTSVLLALSCFLYSRWHSKNFKSEKYPPKSTAGILESVRKLSGSEFPWFVLKCAREINSWIYRLPLLIPGLPMVVIVGEGADWRSILQDPATTKPRESMYGCVEAVTSGYPTMFSTNGEFWHSHRKAISPAFSSAHVRRMNQVALAQTEDWISNRLKPMVEKGESFDISKEMVDIMLDSICETAFEYKMSGEEKVIFLEALDLAFKEFVFKTMVNPLRAIFGMFIPERRRARVAAGRMFQIAKNVMENYRALESPSPGTIIDRIMKSEEAITSDEHRAAEILLFLIGGHDSTGYSIAWLLLELARHPELQKDLRADLNTRDPSEWSQSDLLRKFARESMRLNPASSGSIRTIGRDFTTKDGFFIPKASIILMPSILVHRNPCTYHDPESYRPERWDHPSKEMLDSFLPFSFGKQNCIGQSLAIAEVHNVAARIFSEYELEVVDNGTVEFFITLKPLGARLKARKMA